MYSKTGYYPTRLSLAAFYSSHKSFEGILLSIQPWIDSSFSWETGAFW